MCGPARVLLVLDEPILEFVKLTLNHGLYTTRTASTYVEATTALSVWRPHLMILDHDLCGVRLMERIRRDEVGLPAMVVTRRGDLEGTLSAFDLGASDVLTIPFAPEELLARVIGLLRRAYSDVGSLTPVIKFGDLEIDILNCTVLVGGAELHLTSLEQSLLYLLAANAGRVVSREEILDTLWGVDFVAESDVVDRHIRNLHARLQTGGRKARLITIVPGRGYQIRLPSVAGASASQAS
jgi:two-component system OmpR family response regulator